MCDHGCCSDHQCTEGGNKGPINCVTGRGIMFHHTQAVLDTISTYPMFLVYKLWLCFYSTSITGSVYACVPVFTARSSYGAVQILGKERRVCTSNSTNVQGFLSLQEGGRKRANAGVKLVLRCEPS